MKQIYYLTIALIFLTGCYGIEFPEPAKATPIEEFIAVNYEGCTEIEYCADLVKVDCGAAVDKPLYYLDKNTGEEISVCGGACRTASEKQREICQTLCPPQAWNC